MQNYFIIHYFNNQMLTDLLHKLWHKTFPLKPSDLNMLCNLLDVPCAEPIVYGIICIVGCL